MNICIVKNVLVPHCMQRTKSRETSLPHTTTTNSFLPLSHHGNTDNKLLLPIQTEFTKFKRMYDHFQGKVYLFIIHLRNRMLGRQFKQYYILGVIINLFKCIESQYLSYLARYLLSEVICGPHV
jgi:hypothetical protein